MNLWDILILFVIAGIAAFAFFRVRKRKAEGKITSRLSPKTPVMAQS